MKILAVSGSLSAASSNTALLGRIREAAPPDEVALFEGLDDIPHFSPERESADVPVAVAAFRHEIQNADAVLIATPEYAGGMPGVLKNALDWLVGSGDLYDKPSVIVNAAPSEGRGHNARASLELVLRMQGAHVRDSFTVAVARDQAVDATAAATARALARILQALKSVS